jgi:hypothetical protein
MIEGNQIEIFCNNLTKKQINSQIRNKTKNHDHNIELIILGYDHDDLEDIILPDNVTILYLENGNIKTFSGLILPVSLIKFWCSRQEITSFRGLLLPNTLIEFNCPENQITSFAGLKLPPYLKIFNCSNNQIKSYFVDNGLAGLRLPDSLTEFICSNNLITSFDGLTPNPNLFHLNCLHNDIKEIHNFTLPSSLGILQLDSTVKFMAPKFNSVLKYRLANELDIGRPELSIDNLIFDYFNFRLNYRQYNQILNILNLK